MKKRVIPNRIRVSFQMKEKPVPFSMISFTITMNQRAGIMVESHCRIFGILSTGKINPDNNIVGSINPIILSTMAIC